MKEATEIYDLIKIKYVNPARQLILKNKYSEAKIFLKSGDLIRGDF
ncbi:MAG: hypothetical protein ACTSR3_20190 [Candidatus Helarchaeota archaeon]